MLHHKSFINTADSIITGNESTGHFFLAYMDISEFQLINRYYGAEKGNHLLDAVEKLLGSIPEILAFERVFSDHFAALAFTESAFTKEEIAAFYKRWEKEFLDQQKMNYPACNLKISCGIYAMSGDSITDAIDIANSARKESKKNGSYHAVVYDHAALKELSKYHDVGQDANMALLENRVTFFLQPKVSLLTGKIVGAEALARRIGKSGDVIYPDTFLQFLEANGSIVDLDIQIFEQVCAFLSDRIKNGLPVVRTSVNLSRLHIQNTETAEILHAIAQKYEISPHYIEFELTETILLNEFAGAKVLIDRLRKYQYHVSIDDFGSGYAGINIWQELNFDILKLDRSFLSDEQPLKSKNAAIVPNVINIAQRLGIEVLYEGVETEEQCRYLVKLGCTCVQGYFFSRPVSKEQFYQVYQNQKGYYDCSFPAGDDLPEQSPGPPRKSVSRRKAPRYLLLLFFCAVFLIICSVLTLGFYRDAAGDLFIDSVRNNLESYSNGQTAAIHADITDTVNTLSAFAALIDQRNDKEFIDTYITALNETEPEITFLFSTAEEFDRQLEQGKARAVDAEYVERLKKGEVVVSDIAFSELAGNIYCFSIGVPVFSHGEFAGGLRAIINADILVDTEQYLSPYGVIEDAFITDGNGTILLSDHDMDIPQADDLFQYAEDFSFSDRALLKLQKKFSDGNAGAFYLEKINGVPYYISVSSLDYNNWKSVVIFRAGETKGMIGSLFNYTVMSALILMSAVLIICFAIAIYLKRWMKRIDADTARYLLLEQFSDTVLFDYDKANDTIRFTPNANQLFDVGKWTHEGFLRHLEQAEIIHPADYAVIRDAMTGESRNEKDEMRVRFRHPSDGHFYWCLIQYKYIREKGRILSIVGKIVNIDEQQRYEERLIKQAMTDHLTGLYNKSASERLVRQYLEEDKTGLLFMIDIDDFKQINDMHGHLEGDCVIQSVSRCLKKTFRSNDIIGRIGGDELLVYMRKVCSPDLVHKKMRDLEIQLNEHFKHDTMPLTVSAGAASCPDDGESFDELYQRADQLMYRAKQSGKHQYCYKGQIYPFGHLDDVQDGGQ